MQKQLVNTKQIAELQQLILGAIDGIKKAGNLLCQMIDEDSDIIEFLVKEGYFQRAFLTSLEKVGRQQLCPELFLAETPGHRMLKSLPYREQVKYLSTPVKVLIMDDSGKTDTLLVVVENLTSYQCRQVCDGKNMLDLPAQRAFLESDRARQIAPKKTVIPYKVVGKTVSFIEPCSLGRKELLQILQQLG